MLNFFLQTYKNEHKIHMTCKSDVCGAIGTTIDCTAGCSVLKTQFQGSVRNMRKVYKVCVQF
jgi:hypothetical protein